MRFNRWYSAAVVDYGRSLGSVGNWSRRDCLDFLGMYHAGGEL